MGPTGPVGGGPPLEGARKRTRTAFGLLSRLGGAANGEPLVYVLEERNLGARSRFQAA